MTKKVKEKKEVEVTTPQQDISSSTLNNNISVEPIPEELEPSIIIAEKPTPKYGRFFRGTDSIEGERAYKALYNANRNAGGWGMTNMALKAIEEGNDVYRGSDGSIVIKDLQGNDITEKYLPKGVTAKVSDRQGKKNWGATFNSANHRFRVSGEYLDSIDLTPEDLRTELRRGTGTGFFTIQDENGNNIYDTNSKQNQDYENLIRELISYSQGNPKELDKKYKYSNWKESDRQALLNLGDEFSSDPEYADALISRIREGKLTDSDKDILTKMGILASKVTPAPDNSKDDSDNVNPFQLNGINIDAAKRHGITGIKENTDEKGNTYYTIEGDNFSNSTWDLYGFDSVFGKTKFNNGWIHNGRLYLNGDENKVGELQNAVRDYLSTYIHPGEKFSDFWNRRKNSGVRFLGDAENPLYDFSYNNTYDQDTRGALYNYFKTNNIENAGVTDVSRYYGLADGSIYGYIDTAGSTDIHGNPVMKYIDKNGNVVNINNYKTVDFPDNRVPTLNFSTLENGKFTYGTFDNNKGTARVSVEWDPITNQYSIYRASPEGGKRINPINIHSSRTDEFLDYIKNKKWEKYSDLENFGKSAKSYKFSGYGNGYIPTNKQGGKINWNKVDKLAEGGMFGVGNMKASNSKVNNEKVSDITKSHALDGSDGGLTEAEKLQIAAAIGDAAGVALSFIPGAGDVAGVGTGAASSTTRFIADIKKDGFQGKDALSFAGNLLLDAASVIHGFGTGARGYKLVKAIKGIGQPLIKWLSIAGASSAVLNTAKKAINGEKMTGEDLSTLISGIGSAAIASKSIAKDIGQAKLAKKVDTKMAESFNKNINTPKSASADGFTFSKTPQELETLMSEVKTKSGAISKLQELASAEGKTLSAENAEKMLRDLGVNITKGKVSFSFKNNKLRHLFFGRGETGVEFNAPAEKEVGSTFSYLLSPKKRVKALGWEATYGIPTKKANTNLGNTFSSVEFYSALDNVKNRKGSLLEKALIESSVISPESFGTMFHPNGSLHPVLSINTPTFGGKRYYRNPRITDNKFLLPAPNNTNPVSVNYGYSPRPQYHSPQSTIIRNYDSLPAPDNIWMLQSPKKVEMLPMPPGYSPINVVTSPTMVPTLLAGRSGVIYLPYKNSEAIITPRTGKESWLSEIILERSLKGRTKSPYMPLSTARTYYNGPSALEYLAFKEGGQIPKYQAGGKPGEDKKEKIINSTLNILPGALDTLDLGRVISANNRYTDKMKEAAKKANIYATSPILQSPRLDLSPIIQGRNNARNSYLSQIAGITPTSDINTNRAQALVTAESMLNFDNKVNEQITNAVSQNNSQLVETNNQNRINEANTAYNNAKQHAAVQQAISEAEANNIQSINSALSDFSQQARTMLRDYRSGINNLNYQKDISNLDKELSNKKDEAIKSLKDDYDIAVKNGTVTDDFEDWIKSDTARYKQYSDALDVKFDPIKTNKDSFSYWYNTYYLPEYRKSQQRNLMSRSFKKGGKINEQITDKIAVENSKMSKQAILQMNKELLTLLNKLVK